MQNKINILFIAVGLLCVMACNESATSTETTTEAEVKEIATPMSFPIEKDGLTVYPLTGSPAYDNASLTVAEGNEDPTQFAFVVENYELGAQTEGAGENGLANSGKGQHIHFIVDNSPYAAYYEPEFTHELEDGNHVILAFLSRSYHESVKNPSAFQVMNLKVGEGEAEEADLSAPHMFYSRPKGTYKGADTDKLMLDFYLVNVDLAPDGNKVRATVNGTEFTFDKWQPYIIEGLEKGEATIKLELLDAGGDIIPGPFNSVERTVMLEEADQ